MLTNHARNGAIGLHVGLGERVAMVSVLTAQRTWNLPELPILGYSPVPRRRVGVL